MPKTTQLTVGTVTPVAITIRSSYPVLSVTVRENRNVAGWPTTAWNYSGPTWDAGNAAGCAPGEAKTFAAPPGSPYSPFAPGLTIAQILAVTGTTTFDQIEEP